MAFKTREKPMRDYHKRSLEVKSAGTQKLRRATMTIRRSFLILTSLIAITTLSACKTAIEARVYYSDVMAVTRERAIGITTPMEISIEVISEDKCNEFSASGVEALKSQFSKAEFIGCSKREFDTFADFRVAASIINYPEDIGAYEEPSSPIFLITQGRDAKAIVVALWADREKMKKVFDALPKSIRSYHEFEFDPEVSAVIVNDSRERVDLTVSAHVFLDGSPVTSDTLINIDGRSERRLVMSNVANVALATQTPGIIRFGRFENLTD